MHSTTHAPPFFLLLLLFLLLLCSDLVKSQPDNATFSNCTRTFACGSIQSIAYPFSAANGPDHCGPPEFRLSCRSGFPELSIMSVSYRVIQLDDNQKTLTLARIDLSDNICPTQYANSTFNLHIFNYVDVEDLTLFYRCDSVDNFEPSVRFSCNVSDDDHGYAYFIVGPVPNDPSLQIVNCSVSVKVPIPRSERVAVAGNETALKSVLREGFQVNYTVPDEDHCWKCFDRGGQCGFDSKFNEFACFCNGRRCHISGGKSKLSTGAGIGIGGAGIAGILLIGSLAYCMLQRRKRIISQTKSKDLSNPSSKGLTTPSTTFSQSIPSYPSSSSADLEKGSMYFGVQMFTYAELEEATDNFDASRELGDGGFGVVYFGKLRDGREVAVKRLYENNFKRVEQFMNEVEILTRLRHQNLVMLYGCTSRRSRELLLVYEYIPNGTVADHLHGQKENSGLVSWPVRLGVALETADALAYLHASDIIHRDVKTNNILLDKNFRVKVADFGLSRLFPTNVTHVSTAPQGTPGYVDPEYYQCYQLTNKSDVYSFGVVLVELISSKEAVDTNRHRHDINLANMALSKIQNHALHELVDPCLGFETNYTVRRTVTLVAELAFRCLQQEREVRPSMDEVLKVLRGIQVEELNAQKAETADTGADDVGLLKGNAFSFSPDSVVNAKWASNDATPNSF